MATRVREYIYQRVQASVRIRPGQRTPKAHIIQTHIVQRYGRRPRMTLHSYSRLTKNSQLKGKIGSYERYGKGGCCWGDSQVKTIHNVTELHKCPCQDQINFASSNPPLEAHGHPSNEITAGSLKLTILGESESGETVSTRARLSTYIGRGCIVSYPPNRRGCVRHVPVGSGHQY